MGARAIRDAVLVHLGFGLVAVAGLALPAPALGWRLLGLVVLYNVALPVVGRVRGHRGWVGLWAFLLPLSFFQVVPDAFLADALGSIDFPDTGGPRIGPLPLAMAGMWTIPLWASLFAADWLGRGDLRRGTVWAAVLAGGVLVASEATLWAVPIWRAVDVAMVGPVALYVILPEVLLGAVAYRAWQRVRDRSRGLQVVAAALVSTLYLGALAASYLLVDVW